MAARRIHTCLAAALGAALVATSVPAAADDLAPAPAAMPAPIADGMRGYYASERSTAFLFIGVGAGSAAAGGVLAATAPRDGDFSRGLGWSLLTVGVLEAAGAAFYAFQVNAEIDHYSAALAKDPTAFKREELAHIHGTTSRFVAYRLSELALAAGGAGVATYGFVKNQDTWKGVGIGVAAEALTFFVLDSFGQARAKAYEDEVRGFNPEMAIEIGGGERPTTLGVRSRF